MASAAASPTAPPAAAPRLGMAWWMVAVLFTLYVLSWVDRLIISMLVTPMKADLGLTDVQVSMVTSTSFAIFYALFGLPLGWAADRFPRRWIIFGGVLVWALATIGCGYATSYEALLLGRIMVGAGEAALLPATYSLIADAFPREKLTLATSTFQMAGKTGSAVAFGVGGAAIAYATAHVGAGGTRPWQYVLMMVGAPGLVLAFLVFTFADPGRRGGPARAAKGELAAFLNAHRQLVALMLVGTSALAICGYSMTNWVPAFIERHYGLKPPQYGVWLSAMNLFAAASLVATGWIVDRLFARGMDDAHLRFYSWLILGMSPIVAFTFFAPNVWLFLACYGLIQLITGPFMVFVSSIMALLAPSAVRAQLLALFLFVFTLLGHGAGPAIVATITDHVLHDEARVGTSLAIVVIVGATVAFVSFRAALRWLGPAVAQSRRS